MSQLNVTMMGLPFTLGCKDGEEAALQQAVELVDKRMAVLRDGNKVRGSDRIAIMTALGLAAELLEASVAAGPFPGENMLDVEQHVAAMHDTLDATLAEITTTDRSRF